MPMTAETVRWLIGILVTLFIAGVGTFVTVLISVINRKNDTIARLQEANLNYRLALLQSAPVGEAASKLLQAFPLSMDEAGK